MSDKSEWLIKKGEFFYRTNKSGYTSSKFDAGRYTKADADREAAIEPWHMSAVHQDGVADDPASAAKATIESEASSLRSQLQAAEKRVEDLTAERDQARSIVREIYWMALRYADGRKTYAPDMYNQAVRKAYDAGWLTYSTEGNRDPQYASDGMFDAEYVSMSVRAVRAEATVAEMRKALEEIDTALDGEPEYHQSGMGCGLEDRNITDRYEAMHHGWDCAIERVYSEHITPAIDAARATLTTKEPGDASLAAEGRGA